MILTGVETKTVVNPRNYVCWKVGKQISVNIRERPQEQQLEIRRFELGNKTIFGDISTRVSQKKAPAKL